MQLCEVQLWLYEGILSVCSRGLKVRVEGISSPAKENGGLVESAVVEQLSHPREVDLLQDLQDKVFLIG